MRRIVILGGGYGGMKIATMLLEKVMFEDYEIKLIDREPYHNLKTEFYALAAGAVSDRSIREDFPKHERMELITSEILEIDTDYEKIITRDKGVVEYDYLVIGLGSEDNFHNIDGASEFTYGVQTIKRTRKAYEAIQNVEPFGQVTIVGGGLTGVEIASELRETRPDLKIRILDRGDAILSNLPKKLQEYVTSWFNENNVEIIHHANVDYVEKHAVCNNGVCLKTDVTVWAAGVRPSRVIRKMDEEKDNYGRLVLDDFHRLKGKENVFVVGDNASLPYAPSAQLAKQQGKQIVDILISLLQHQEPKKPEEIKVKGSLGSLGSSEGFGTAFNAPMTGFIPRLLKSGVLWLHKFNK